MSRSQTQDRRLTRLSVLLRGEPDNTNHYDSPLEQEYDPSLSDFLDLQRTSQSAVSPDPNRHQPTPVQGKSRSLPADPAEDADFDPFLGESYSPSTEPGKSDFQPISGPTKGHSSGESLTQQDLDHSPTGPAKPASTETAFESVLSI